jgi:hypothetical protein
MGCLPSGVRSACLAVEDRASRVFPEEGERSGLDEDEAAAYGEFDGGSFDAHEAIPFPVAARHCAGPTAANMHTEKAETTTHPHVDVYSLSH